ncbi:MAG TPA: phosphopantetheine-binding protein [Actinokineospora sp.]|jgi:acyl carrier protein|nr:phosphopantetheine-binding protein [Actinokineospora sp.]
MTTTTGPTVDAVLDDIRSMLVRVLDQYGLDDVEITTATTFHEDLGLESIDLVTVGSMMTDQYGEQVNLAAFLADLDIDDVIGLRVGTLVDFVHAALSGPPRTGS